MEFPIYQFWRNGHRGLWASPSQVSDSTYSECWGSDSALMNPHAFSEFLLSVLSTLVRPTSENSSFLNAYRMFSSSREAMFYL